MAGYNGWTNYETWVANLWMDNDEGSQDYWRERATEQVKALDRSSHEKAGDDNFDPSDLKLFPLSTDEADEAALDFAEELKEWHFDNIPENEGVYGDLLTAAIGEVNWYEIARHMIDGLAE